MTFKPGIHIFDKRGRPAGIIERYEVVSTPSYLLNDVGSFSFYLARRQWEQMYLALDRMVMIGNSLGMPPWAGQIDEIEYGGGVIQVSCSGILEQFRTTDIEIDEELVDNTPAWAVYRRLWSLVNLQKGRDGEVQWRFSYAGVKPYYGDLTIRTNAFSALQSIAERSETEFYASASIDKLTGNLIPMLHVSDYVTAGVGKTLRDGDNVIEGPRWSTESRPIRNRVRLRGATTNISDYVPEWMRWAVHDFEPQVEIVANPGDKRTRVDMEASVEWSLSKKEQRRLANLTVNHYWGLYRSFIRAIHDSQGRPWHPGWEWSGPPDSHPMLHTGIGWRNHLALAEVNGIAASMVMQSRSERQVAMVRFSRVSGQQTFRRHFYQDGRTAAELLHMEVNGLKYRYTIEGGVITAKVKVTLNHRKAYVTPYQVAYLNPEDGTYTRLRRVIGGEGNLLEGDYFTDVIPNTFSGMTGSPYLRYTTVYLPHDVNASSSLISKMYALENQRISEWDPRSDGIGQELNVPTVWKQAVTTRARWHIVPWRPGLGGTAKLAHGVNSTATTMSINTTFDLPDAPFNAEINQGTSRNEIVRVTKKVGGGEIVVRRGQSGTSPKYHEAGEPIQATGIIEWDGFKWPYTWPEGQAWLQRHMARVMQPPVRLSISVVNKDDLWRDITLGRGHIVSLISEGPGATGTYFRVRVIGFSPDNAKGRMELLLEKLP